MATTAKEVTYLIIQAARDTGTVQYKLQNATYSFLTLQWQKFVPANWRALSTAQPALPFRFNRPRLQTLEYTE